MTAREFESLAVAVVYAVALVASSAGIVVFALRGSDAAAPFGLVTLMLFGVGVVLEWTFAGARVNGGGPE